MVLQQNQTLTQWLAHHVTEWPQAPAIIDAEGTLNYGELGEAVGRLASGLASRNIGRGDVVGVQLPNTRTFIIALLAIAARGAIFQTLHMPYRSKELSQLMADSGAKAALVTHGEKDSRLEDVLSVKGDLPALETIIVAGDASGKPGHCIALSDLMETPADENDVLPTSPDDRYLLLYTSGTTAAPKGVPHIYRSFLDNALLSAAEMDVGSGDRVLSLAPMTHLYGLFTLHMTLATGAASVLLPAFNPATLLQDLKNARATHVYSAPAHFAPFVARGVLEKDLFAGIRILCLSGSAVPVALAEAMDALLPEGDVIQLWGMSELQAGSYGRPGEPAKKRLRTAGAASPGTQLRVVDEAGAELSPGEEGALQMRGDSLFKGYLNRPDETEKAFDQNGWFATGDLATLDEDGYLTITGRTKEIINRGGVKFNPVEVEELLMVHPAIQQCAIVPVPDPDLGERGCLCVQPTPGESLALEDALAILEEKGLAKYKWPESLEILDELPMTPTRKVMRGRLSEILQSRKD